jgi:uncharacterized protein YecT (DUF1311 family)
VGEGSRDLEAKYVLILCSLALAACGKSQDVAAGNATRDGTTDAMPLDSAVERSMCPDNHKVELEDCKFAAAMAPLKEEGSAVDRFAATLCGKYDQVTINFCVGKLSAFAETELVTSLERARRNPALNKLVANQSRWLGTSRKYCIDKYDGSQDGTGYASFVTFCEIELTARRIDELNGSIPKVDR